MMLVCLSPANHKLERLNSTIVGYLKAFISSANYPFSMDMKVLNTQMDKELCKVIYSKYNNQFKLDFLLKLNFQLSIATLLNVTDKKYGYCCN